VIVRQRPVDAQLLPEVVLAIQGLKRCLGHTPVGEFDKPVTRAAARTLVLRVRGVDSIRSLSAEERTNAKNTDLDHF
jgi:hypothetical protein